MEQKSNQKIRVLESELLAALESQTKEVAKLKAELASLKSQSSSASNISSEVKAVREELAEAKANQARLERRYDALREDTKGGFDKALANQRWLAEQAEKREAEKKAESEKPVIKPFPYSLFK